MKRYFGSYKATVVDNTDPESRNRLKVQVSGMMDGIPKEYLPWADYKSNMFVLAGAGQFITPPEGSKVTVDFRDDGDINFPTWSGGIVESKDELPDKNQEGRYILFRSPDKSIVIAFNENSGDIEIKTKKFNTTLDELMTQAKGHVHLATVQGANTSNPLIALPPDTMPPNVFNTGKL